MNLDLETILDFVVLCLIGVAYYIGPETNIGIAIEVVLSVILILVSLSASQVNLNDIMESKHLSNYTDEEKMDALFEIQYENNLVLAVELILIEMKITVISFIAAIFVFGFFGLPLFILITMFSVFYLAKKVSGEAKELLEKNQSGN